MDIEKAKRALVNAHKAGDTAAATKLAKAIKTEQTIGVQTKPEGVVDSFTQGVTFGLGDELTALEAGVLGKTPGGGWFDYSKSFGERYDDALAAERGQQEQFREENPGTAFAAELAGGVATGAGLASKGATLIGRTAGQGLKKRVAAGMGEGAAYGGAYGFGSGEGGLENRIDSAAIGGVTGALLGGAVPTAGEGARRATNYVGSKLNPKGQQQQAGIDLVKKAANRAGLATDDLIDGVRDGRNIAQQDQALTRLTKSVYQQPSKSRGMIKESLDQGYDANRSAARQKVAQAMDAEPNFYRWLDGFKKAKGAGADKAYTAVFAQNWGKKGPPFALDDLMQSGRIPASALKEARALAQVEGRPFGKNLIASLDETADTVTFSRLPSLEEAEIIRRGIKSATSKAYRDGSAVAPALKNLEKEMRSVIDGASPNLRKVRQAYATASQIQDAADLGLKLTSKSADEIEFLLDDMAPTQVASLRKAFSSDLKHKIEKGDLNRDAIRGLFGSERAQRVLGMLWPDKGEFAKFRRQMENSAEFNAARQKIQGGSDTAENLYAAGDLNTGSLVGAATRTLRGDMSGLVDLAIQFGAKSLNPAKGLPEEQLKRAAEILITRDPQQAQKLLTEVSKGNSAAFNAFQKKLNAIIASPAVNQRATVGLVSGF
ncbi:hypothetical protein [Roseibium sp.]|uniref:hypothetical protein n=1 Tax=Roseibium sp. TaxID=1936156 RepID=UPI003B52FFD1